MNPVFKTPPRDLELLPEQVHIWSASLNQSDSCLRLLYETLSQDERERAKRFVFEKDRRRFISCRGILRNILADYLGFNSNGITFLYGMNGKPALGNPFSNEDLYFNLSHSGDLALYALSRDNEIGVDVEYMRDLYDIEQIAERIFSQNEIESFRALPVEKKKGAFFTGWTRKEALLKALGDGLILPMDHFEASAVPGKQPGLTGADSHGCNIAGWTILDLKPAPDYTGALALKDCVSNTSCWQWKLNQPSVLN